ncbi:MAG: flagellar biosynthetic protein FliQ [Planctomyces sp.]|nr:flagellar biosynthetic protein FliQ [Planctomyces sp.]
MSTSVAIDLLQSAASTTIVLAAPILAVLVAIALVVNVLQTLTQLHDQTLAFVPRLVGSVLVILLLLPWLLGRLSDYAIDVYRQAPLAS